MANEVRNKLARIPLRWMIRQCFLLNTGIIFHVELLKKIGLDPTSLYPVVKPRPPPISSIPNVSSSASLSEEEEDIIDAHCPIYDQLVISPAWWILEYIPAKLRYQKSDNTTEKAVT